MVCRDAGEVGHLDQAIHIPDLEGLRFVRQSVPDDEEPAAPIPNDRARVNTILADI